MAFSKYLLAVGLSAIVGCQSPEVGETGTGREQQIQSGPKTYIEGLLLERDLLINEVSAAPPINEHESFYLLNETPRTLEAITAIRDEAAKKAKAFDLFNAERAFEIGEKPKGPYSHLRPEEKEKSAAAYNVARKADQILRSIRDCDAAIAAYETSKSAALK